MNFEGTPSLPASAFYLTGGQFSVLMRIFLHLT